MLYVNPLGEVINLNYYSNKINNLRKKNILNNAKLEDTNIQNSSIKINLIIYSILAAILILMTIVLLRKI